GGGGGRWRRVGGGAGGVAGFGGAGRACQGGPAGTESSRGVGAPLGSCQRNSRDAPGIAAGQKGPEGQSTVELAGQVERQVGDREDDTNGQGGGQDREATVQRGRGARSRASRTPRAEPATGRPEERPPPRG